MARPATLKTERLLLRPLKSSDIDTVLEYASDPEWPTEWVEDSIDLVSVIMVELLILSPVLGDTLSKLPGAETLVAGLVAEQVGDKIAWSYSAPVQDREELYRVTATAAMELEIDLPIIGVRAYAVTLPIHLLIDTATRTVEEWAVDLENAVVGSY